MKLCSIASGSSGNCIFAGSETTSLLIDAGISGKRVEAGLAVLDRSAKELDGILVTHEHSDHIQGLGVLARRYGIPIYATDGTIQAMQQTKSLGKFPEGIFHTIHADDTFTLGDIAVHPFTISHDAAEPVGYRMESGGKSIAIATDLGVYSDYTVQNLTGLDAVVGGKSRREHACGRTVPVSVKTADRRGERPFIEPGGRPSPLRDSARQSAGSAARPSEQGK